MRYDSEKSIDKWYVWMDKTLQNNMEPVPLEDLVAKYKEQKDNGSFEELFTRCHRDLLQFLLRKKLSVDDAEDLLQDYFINDFDRSVDSFDPTKGKKFINYVRNLVLLRFFSLYQKKKRENELRDFSLDNALPSEEFKLTSQAAEKHEGYEPTLLMKDEIKDFFRDAVLSISNQNHRNALIMRLCLPIKISTEEAGEILNCSKSSYTTWIYRGTLDLQAVIEEKRESMSFDLQEALRFVMEDSFTIKYETLDELENNLCRDLLKGYLFDKKSHIELGGEKGMPEDEIKKLVWRGLFEVLNLLNKPELLFRSGGDMSIERDDVLNYLDSLDDSVAGHQRDFKTRSSVTTGDRSLDELLYTVHELFRPENKENAAFNLRDEFLAKAQEKKLSIDEVAESYDIPPDEIRKLLLGSDSVAPEAELKIYQFIGQEPGKSSEDISGYEKEFDKLNTRLLKMYYDRKKS